MALYHLRSSLQTVINGLNTSYVILKCNRLEANLSRYATEQLLPSGRRIAGHCDHSKHPRHPRRANFANNAISQVHLRLAWPRESIRALTRLWSTQKDDTICVSATIVPLHQSCVAHRAPLTFCPGRYTVFETCLLFRPLS